MFGLTMGILSSHSHRKCQLDSEIFAMNRNFCFLTELVLACRCLCVSPAVLLVLANSHTFAVPIIDNFELDTSGNYQGTDWFGTGGSFLVAGGKLRVTTWYC